MEFSNVKSHRATTYLLIFLLGIFNVQLAFSFTGDNDHSCKTHHKKHSNKGDRTKDCGENGYSTEIISIEPDGECFWYKIKVVSNNQNNFELSHYDIDLGCGTISEAYNSGGWKMEYNHEDPSTGFAGLKVDDISGFGKNPWFSKFYVKFKFCPDESCEVNPECLTPEAAYKAGQCIFYEEIQTGSVCDATPELQVSSESVNPRCFNSADGSIALQITGGTKPYSISWNSGQTDSVLTELVKGEYSYEVTDAGGNSVTGSLELTAPDALELTAEVINPSCAGTNSGSIDLTVVGGTGPYSFAWSTTKTTEDLSELTAGAYDVTVTDQNGCSAIGSFTLENSTQISVIPYVVQPSCGSDNGGSIELDVAGGVAPYTFLWSDGSEEQNRYDLAEGSYSVTISDQGGCQITKGYIIKTQSPIMISPIVTHSNCLNEPVGSIELTVIGGTEPYTFDWSNGATTQNIDGLTAGKYSVDVTDANGCIASYDVNINTNEMVLYAYQTSVPNCPGDPSASVDLTVFFGEGPYTYEWSNGATTEDLTDIPSGTYTVIVTDNIGCTAERTVEVKDQNPIIISYIVDVNGCSEAPEYDVTVSVSGGDGNYTYNWLDGSTSSSASFTEAGTYSVEVTDGNGCTVTQDIVVEGTPGTPTCLINQPDEMVVCSSMGNTLYTSIDGAIIYDWKVTSTDGSWTITSATNTDQIEYTAGNEGSMATFYLEVLLGSGCTAICVLDVSTCQVDNPDDGGDNPDDGGDNPDGGCDNPNDGGDNPDDGGTNPGDGHKDCTDCFYSSDVAIVKSGYYYEYTFTVNHNGECNFDLSHLTISLPECAWIVDYSNSMGWKMEKIHEDPTTGISGIKIDDIPEFGKDANNSSFEVNIKLKSSDWSCKEELNCFAPELAYKAGQCVEYEQTTSDCIDSDDPDIITYPNPTHDRVKVCFNKDSNDRDYKIELFNYKGEKIDYYDRKSGYDNNCEFNLSRHHGSMFFINVTRNDGYTKSFKICKK